jgi:hypothetical protein
LEPFQGYNYEENRTLAPRVGKTDLDLENH